MVKWFDLDEKNNTKNLTKRLDKRIFVLYICTVKPLITLRPTQRL